MKLASLIAAALALACATPALAAPAQVLKPSMAIGPVTNAWSYRFVDAKSEATGLRLHDFALIYGRAGIRIDGDAHDIQITNGRLTPKAPTSGNDLPVGIDLRGTVHGVTITGVTSTRNLMKPAPGYPNGDGFSTETGVYDITFLDDVATDNNDGGFDTKGKVKLIRPDSERNHRNYRGWDQASYVDPVSRDPNDSHWWLSGWKGNRITVTGVLTVSDKGAHPVFNCGGNAIIDLTGVTAYRFNVAPGTPLTRGPCTMLYGDLGKPDLTVQWAPPPPPATMAAPSIVTPAYDYTSQAVIPDGNHDGFVTVATDPVLLKLFPKGTVLKLVASDVTGFHYNRVP